MSNSIGVAGGGCTVLPSVARRSAGQARREVTTRIRHAARIWLREGRVNPAGASFLQTASSLKEPSLYRGLPIYIHMYCLLYSKSLLSTEGLLDLLRSQMGPSGQTQKLAVIHRRPQEVRRKVGVKLVRGPWLS